MNPFFDNDSYIYDSFGRFFSEHTSLFDPTLTLVPMQPLGYHFFVGLVYKIFGPGMAGIIFVQAILAFAIVFFTYRIANRLCTQTTARIALILCVTNLGLIVYTHLLLAEILLTFFCMLFWERMLAYHDRPSTTTLAQAAFFLSCSSLAKPIALVFSLPLLVMIWRWYGGRACALFAGIFYTPIILYMLRNWYLYDLFLFAPMMQVNIYQCFLSKVIAKVEGCAVDDVLKILTPTSSNLFDPHLWDMQRELFWNYFTQHPGVCCIVWLQNVAKTVCGLFTTQLKIMFNPALRGGATSFFLQKGSDFSVIFDYLWFGTSSWILFALGFAEMIWNGLRFFLVASGVPILYAQHRRFVLMASTFSFLTIFSTGVDGCFRYRMPCEPLFCIVVAVVLERLYRFFIRKNSHLYGVILAGGSGERLWPLSRQGKPKQFLVLGSSKTLLDQAIDRVARVVGVSHVALVTSAQHAALCTSPIEKIIEPESRNTAPALLLSCVRIQEKDPDAIIMCAPADAFIPESEYETFERMMRIACEYAKRHDCIVLLGVRPTRPATGYGYIEYEPSAVELIHPIIHFHEKPSPIVAQHYCEQPNMLWNIGIFVGRARVFMEEAMQHAPQVHHALMEYERGVSEYSAIPSISIDYAVIEKSTRTCVLPVKFSWCDVGTLESFLEIKHQYENPAHNVVHVNSPNSIVDAPGTLVALVDADDLCVVKRADVLVISRRSETDKVRGVVTQLKQQNRMEYW